MLTYLLVYFNCNGCIPHLTSDFKLCMTRWRLSFLSFAKAIANMTNNPVIIKTTPTITAAISPAVYKAHCQSHH